MVWIRRIIPKGDRNRFRKMCNRPILFVFHNLHPILCRHHAFWNLSYNRDNFFLFWTNFICKICGKSVSKKAPLIKFCPVVPFQLIVSFLRWDYNFTGCSQWDSENLNNIWCTCRIFQLGLMPIPCKDKFCF